LNARVPSDFYRGAIRCIADLLGNYDGSFVPVDAGVARAQAGFPELLASRASHGPGNTARWVIQETSRARNAGPDRVDVLVDAGESDGGDGSSAA
jgi:hypothetical protein